MDNICHAKQVTVNERLATGGRAHPKTLLHGCDHAFDAPASLSPICIYARCIATGLRFAPLEMGFSRFRARRAVILLVIHGWKLEVRPLVERATRGSGETINIQGLSSSSELHQHGRCGGGCKVATTLTLSAKANVANRLGHNKSTGTSE